MPYQYDESRDGSGRWSAPVMSVKDNKRLQWAKYVHRKYACEVEDVARLLLAQDFKCPICDMAFTCGEGPAHADFPTADDNWSIDHDHATSRVRGVLCQPCNWHAVAWVERIGRERLDRILKYLDTNIA